MKTRIKIAHEETHKGETTRTVGVLFNYSDENPEFRESYIFIYKKGMYIFFETIVDMINYLFYGTLKLKRAYVEEQVFDNYYDAKYIDGKFGEHLTWVIE